MNKALLRTMKIEIKEMAQKHGDFELFEAIITEDYEALAARVNELITGKEEFAHVAEMMKRNAQRRKIIIKWLKVESDITYRELYESELDILTQYTIKSIHDVLSKLAPEQGAQA